MVNVGNFCQTFFEFISLKYNKYRKCADLPDLEHVEGESAEGATSHIVMSQGADIQLLIGIRGRVVVLQLKGERNALLSSWLLILCRNDGKAVREVDLVEFFVLEEHVVCGRNAKHFHKAASILALTLTVPKNVQRRDHVVQGVKDPTPCQYRLSTFSFIKGFLALFDLGVEDLHVAWCEFTNLLASHLQTV